MLVRRRYLLLAALFAAALLQAQRGYRYRFEEDEDAPMPADASEKTEFVFARLKYSSARGGYGFWRGRWATDYPKADRQFLQGLRRLSRIHTRSVEQVVDMESTAIFNYPWIYAVEVGSWDFTEAQAARLRDYLGRGGFLLVDDFHGEYEWDVFVNGFRKVLPEAQIVDLPNSEQVFHVLYDLDQRGQVPGVHTVFSGRTYEKGGIDPHWRGVFDERGRLVVAICHNMDLGDAWEWADDPRYPEHYASLAYRIALNYIIYSMTH